MRVAPLRPRVRFPWRWLVDSPLVLVTWVVVLLAASTAREVDQALGGADDVRRRASFWMAKVAAETAAMGVSLDDHAGAPRCMTVGDVAVTVQAVGRELRVSCVPPGGGSWSFDCARLPGASPAALGVPATTGVSLAIDPERLAGAFSAAELPAFRRDAGIALLHLDTGTDRDDFVLDGQHARFGIATDLVAVPGHLWIEPGDEPLRLWLERDLTIVVHGNLYVGRSLAIEGTGRLVFATMIDATSRPFADRDGNGRWSAGDETRAGPFEGACEGGGNAYLGLPRRRAAISIASGLVVAGELHLAGPASVDGPVVLGHAITKIGGPGAELVATGARLFRPERELVPGFVPHGPGRPGLLRHAPGNRPVVGEQPLYLAAPGR
ncbi:MAG: hypothetical protein Q7T30_04620 [Planctomycetota bacterium]|nr:hypothetical protein [Planctomycetota bacterium]